MDGGAPFRKRIWKIVKDGSPLFVEGKGGFLPWY